MRETLALLIPACAVAVLVLPPPPRSVRSWLAAVTLGLCLGIGFSSVTTMALIAAGMAVPSAGFVLADLAIWAGIALVGWWMRPNERSGIPSLDDARDALSDSRRPDAGSPIPSPGLGTWTRVDWLVRLAFGATAVAALASVVANVQAAPHGEWDAWAIWNQHARFLFLGSGGDAWHAMFAIDWSQPDYPLLLPASVARVWAYAGQETTLGPALLGGVLGIASVMFVVTSLEGRRAWIAGSLMLGASPFLWQIASQCADVPLACFIVATVAVASGRLQLGAGARGGALVAGATCAMAAWTKNEGLVFGLLMVVSAAILAVRRGERRHLLRGLAGAAPILGALAWFKLTLAPSSVLFEGQSLEVFADRFFDLDRQAIVVLLMGQHAMRWGAPVMAGIVPFLGLAAVWRAIRGGWTVRWSAAVVMLMLASYYLVYTTTPLDVGWHVSTSFDRLLVQVWPSLVLTVFLAGSPEQIEPEPRTPNP